MTGDGNTVTQHFHATHRGRVDWPALCGNPPARADCLQPRPEQTAELTRALEPADRGPAVVGTAVLTSVLSGMGGVGKTQLTAEFLRRWRAGPGHNGLALWVTASSREAVITAYAAAAFEVAVRDDRMVPDDIPERAEWLRSWLATTNRAWLVVLDDLADPADLRSLWPEGSTGACLVTTRRADAALRGHGRVMVPIGQFTPEQSDAYLRDKLSVLLNDIPDVLEAAEDLALALQHLPLALAQAAAFIENYGETCRGYCARLADRRATLDDLFPAGQGGDDYQHTVAATWSISIDAADRLAPAGFARPLLEIASLLDPNGIPREVLTSPAALAYATSTARRADEPAAESISESLSPEQQARDALANLTRLSLAELDHRVEPRAVRVHAMIQRATRESTTGRGQAARAAADALLETWNEDPHDPGSSQAYRDNTGALATHELASLWEPDGHDVLFRAGRSLAESGQVGAASRYWTWMVETANEQLGPDHPDTLTTRHNVALLRGAAGDPAAAATALDGLLADELRVLGPDDRSTLQTREALAHWRGQAGDPTAAATALDDLLTDQLRVLGPDHTDTLNTRENLARYHGRGGSPASAAAALKELLTDRLRVVGPDDTRTLTTRANLIYWQGRAGDPGGAATASEELLVDVLRVFGPDHPETLTILSNLARWQGEAGDLTGAATATEELVADYLRVLGPDHPDTLRTRNDLVAWRGKAGDPTGAATATEELLVDVLRVFGPDHPETLTTRHNLAHWRGEAGDPTGAVTANAELLADYLRLLGPDHPETLTTRHNLVQWRGQAGDPVGAAIAFKQLLTDCLRVLGPDHPDTLRARRHLAYWRRTVESP